MLFIFDVPLTPTHFLNNFFGSKMNKPTANEALEVIIVIFTPVQVIQGAISVRYSLIIWDECFYWTI